jgi:hypothetical protein
MASFLELVIADLGQLLGGKCDGNGEFRVLQQTVMLHPGHTTQRFPVLCELKTEVSCSTCWIIGGQRMSAADNQGVIKSPLLASH